MNQEHLSQPDASDDADELAWVDVEHVAAAITSYWADDGQELKWMEKCWGVLAADGLTSYANAVEHMRCLLRVVALRVISRGFAERAFETGSSAEWRASVDESAILRGDSGRDHFVLGRLAESAGVDGSDDSGDERFDEIVCGLVQQEARVVADSLRRHVGDGRLFAELWMMQQTVPSPLLDDELGDLWMMQQKVTYPLSDDEISDCVNFDLTAGKHVAYEWIVEGLPV
jgi:hypothetical protein